MANQYTTVADVAAKLNGVSITASTTPTTSTVTGWIEEASNELELRTGKIWTSTTASSVLLDYDGSGYLRLPNAPVISIGSLEYNKTGLGGTTDDWTTLTEGYNEDFIIYGDGEIKFYGNSTPLVGNKRIRITYTYGYATTPLWIKKVVTSMTARSFISSVVQGDAKEQGGSVTVGNISITDPSTFSSTFLSQLDTEIDTTLDKNINQSHVYRSPRNYNSRFR